MSVECKEQRLPVTVVSQKMKMFNQNPCGYYSIRQQIVSTNGVETLSFIVIYGLTYVI